MRQPPRRGAGADPGRAGLLGRGLRQLRPYAILATAAASPRPAPPTAIGFTDSWPRPRVRGHCMVTWPTGVDGRLGVGPCWPPPAGARARAVRASRPRPCGRLSSSAPTTGLPGPVVPRAGRGALGAAEVLAGVRAFLTDVSPDALGIGASEEQSPETLRELEDRRDRIRIPLLTLAGSHPSREVRDLAGQLEVELAATLNRTGWFIPDLLRSRTGVTPRGSNPPSCGGVASARWASCRDPQAGDGPPTPRPPLSARAAPRLIGF
jgi:hypothetical protein